MSDYDSGSDSEMDYFPPSLDEDNDYTGEDYVTIVPSNKEEEDDLSDKEDEGTKDEEDEMDDLDDVHLDNELKEQVVIKPLNEKAKKGRGFITLFEIARLIGERAKCLDGQEPTLLSPEELENLKKRLKKERNGSVDVIEIAREEFMLKKNFPILLVRGPYYDGSYYKWSISEMDYFPTNFVPKWKLLESNTV